MMRGVDAVLVAAIFFSTPVLAASVYRWVDESGKVHFGDRPPPQGAQEVKVRVERSAPAVTPSDAERRKKRDRLLREFDRKRDEEKAEKVAENERRERVAERCDEARKLLSDLITASRVFRTGDDGARVYYSDDEREAAKSKLKADIDRHC